MAATSTAAMLRWRNARRRPRDAPPNASSIHILRTGKCRRGHPIRRAAAVNVVCVATTNMILRSAAPSEIRTALLLRDEIALLDVRHEAAFASGHPLFAANMAADRIALEAETRLPRKDVPIVLYDSGEGLVASAADQLAALGYGNVRQLDGGIDGWRRAGYELFEDVKVNDLDDFVDLIIDVLAIANELMLERLAQICQKLLGSFGRLLNYQNPCDS